MDRAGTVIGACYSERKEGDKGATLAARYFIGSKAAEARYYATKLRGH